MRGPLIFTMIFYALIGFILNEIPLQSDGTVFISPINLENSILDSVPATDSFITIANQIFTTISVIVLLLTFRLPDTPPLINLLFILPAAFTVSMIAIQFVRGRGV